MSIGTIAVVCARMGSSRLPNKAMLPLNGEPLIKILIDRVALSKEVDKIVLATTTNPEDEVLYQWGISGGMKNDTVYRGSDDHVLSRVVEAAEEVGAGKYTNIVRVCGDTPLIDPMMIDLAVREVKSGRCDIAMAKNTGRKFPQGTTAHVCRFDNLKRLNEKTNDRLYCEHVTLALYEDDSPFKGRVHEMEGMKEWDCGPTRLQVDYPADYDTVRTICEMIGCYCDIGEIVELLKLRPFIKTNTHCEEKPVR